MNIQTIIPNSESSTTLYSGLWKNLDQLPLATACRAIGNGDTSTTKLQGSAAIYNLSSGYVEAPKKDSVDQSQWSNHVKALDENLCTSKFSLDLTTSDPLEQTLRSSYISYNMQGDHGSGGDDGLNGAQLDGYIKN